MAPPRETPFLDELDKAEKQSGLFLFPGFLSPQEADEAFEVFDNKFPWDLNPKLYGEKLNQHAFLFKRTKKQLQMGGGTMLLEKLCKSIETRFDVQVSDVFCNRFQDPNHDIVWHTDTYGSHIFVLTLGSERDIQFRPKQKKSAKKNNDVEDQTSTIRPGLGDMYFMPLSFNKTHEHRVCPANDYSETTPVPARISFVFFAEPPKYAKEYKITMMDRVRGAWESIIE